MPILQGIFDHSGIFLLRPFIVAAQHIGVHASWLDGYTTNNIWQAQLLRCISMHAYIICVLHADLPLSHSTPPCHLRLPLLAVPCTSVRAARLAFSGEIGMLPQNFTNTNYVTEWRCLNRTLRLCATGDWLFVPPNQTPPAVVPTKMTATLCIGSDIVLDQRSLQGGCQLRCALN